jgi:hypothetical protein
MLRWGSVPKAHADIITASPHQFAASSHSAISRQRENELLGQFDHLG